MEALLIAVIILGLVWRPEPQKPSRPAPPKRFYLDQKVLKRVTNEVPANWGDPDDDKDSYR